MKHSSEVRWNAVNKKKIRLDAKNTVQRHKLCLENKKKTEVKFFNVDFLWRIKYKIIFILSPFEVYRRFKLDKLEIFGNDPLY